MKLTSKELSNTHRVIVFGESKSGKTELVGRLAERYNLLYFDLENGFETLLKLPQEWKDRIEVGLDVNPHRFITAWNMTLKNND